MPTITKIAETQKFILKELGQLKARFALLGSLRRFEELSKEGRQFAKRKGITRKAVLQDD